MTENTDTAAGTMPGWKANASGSSLPTESAASTQQSSAQSTPVPGTQLSSSTAASDSSTAPAASADYTTDSVDADVLLADVEKRSKIERELIARGMTPAEVRRLLNADAHSVDLPNTRANSRPSASNSPAGSSGIVQPAAPAQKSRVRNTDALSVFAAQLISEKAAAQVDAIEAVELDLPDFRKSSVAEEQQASQILRDAALLRRQEKYKEAAVKCREALDLTPKDAAALELLGDLYQGVARTNEALAAYKRAVQADPKRSSAERKYGELLMQQHHWSTADPEAMPRHRGFAIILSLLMPGLGQIHNGEVPKGVFFLIGDAVCAYLLAWSPFGFSGEHRGARLSVSLIASLALTVALYVIALIDTNLGLKKPRD